MTPTTDFRWVRHHLSSIGWDHPSALRHGGVFALVLQQRWSSPYVGVEDEWRDIPIVEVTAEPIPYTITAKGRELLEGK